MTKHTRGMFIFFFYLMIWYDALCLHANRFDAQTQTDRKSNENGEQKRDETSKNKNNLNACACVYVQMLKQIMKSENIHTAEALPVWENIHRHREIERDRVKYRSIIQCAQS